MFNKRSLSILVTTLAITFAAATAQAGLMIDVLTGNPTVGPFSPITPPSDETLGEFAGILFEDDNGNDLQPLTSGGWWSPAGYTIFTTTTHTIEIDLSALNVFGFSFQIGANQNATGWVEAFANGDTDTAAVRRNNIGMSTSRSPGIQITNAGGSCDRITRVVVEPPFTWGIFNMGLDTTGNNCTQVPEPGSLSLLGAGLFGLGLLQQRRRRKMAKAIS